MHLNLIYKIFLAENNASDNFEGFSNWLFLQIQNTPTLGKVGNYGLSWFSEHLKINFIAKVMLLS